MFFLGFNSLHSLTLYTPLCACLSDAQLKIDENLSEKDLDEFGNIVFFLLNFIPHKIINILENVSKYLMEFSIQI